MRTFFSIRRLVVAFSICLSAVAPAAAGAATPVKLTNVASVVFKSTGYLQQKGAKPVTVKDDLRVTGNITVPENKTVDGVDVSALQATVTGQGAAASTLSGQVETLGSRVNTTETTTATLSSSLTALQATVAAIRSLPSCSAGQIAKMGASSWECATDETGVAAADPILPAIPSVPARNITTSVDGSGGGYIGAGASTTIGTDGLPVISYTNVNDRDLKFVHCENVACTASTVSVLSDDATLYTAMIIGSDGNPVIVYDRWSDHHLMLLKCGNPTCSSGNVITSVENIQTGFLSVTVNERGFPIIAYVDSATADLKITSCGSLDCASGNVTRTLDADNVSQNPVSIATSPLGFTYISYSRAGTLKVATCPLFDCEVSILNVLDDGGASEVGSYNSLVVGPDALPVVGYYDQTDANLKIAKCGDTVCSNGAAQFSVVDLTGDMGQGVTMALAPDGFPMAAYMDTTRGYIRFLKCNDANCQSDFAVNDVVNLETTDFFVTHQLSVTLGRNNTPFLAFLNQNTLELYTTEFANIYGKDYLVRR